MWAVEVGGGGGGLKDLRGVIYLDDAREWVMRIRAANPSTQLTCLGHDSVTVAGSNSVYVSITHAAQTALQTAVKEFKISCKVVVCFI